MPIYGCKFKNCLFRKNEKQEVLEHVINHHHVSPQEAEKYIIEAKNVQEYLKIKEELEGREQEGKVKRMNDVLDAEIRAQIESTLKKLLDDYRSLNERVEQLSKRIEGIVGAIGQPQASQTQIPQPQPEVNVLEGEYIPIIRKIAMNPKVLMYYQYARSRGFNGDLADFISEVVEGYFRDRGIKIAVLRGVAEVE